MSTLAGKFGYSTDEELFHGDFATREEAIAELDGKAGWTALYQEVDKDYLAQSAAEEAIEDIQCQLGELCGEASEDGFRVKTEEGLELESFIKGWMERVGVDCYQVTDVKRHEAKETK